MKETPNIAAAEGPDEEVRLKSLLASMFHGRIDSFEFKDVTVRRCVDSIEVVVDYEGTVGGRLYIPSTTVQFAYEWLEEKNEIYGDWQ
jgi:hypothetical protein